MPLSVLLMTGLHRGPDEGHQQRLFTSSTEWWNLGEFLQSHSIAVSECCHRCLSLHLFTYLSASTVQSVICALAVCVSLSDFNPFTVPVPVCPSVPWPALLSLCQTLTPLSATTVPVCPSVPWPASLSPDFNPITVCLPVQSLSVHLCLGLPRCLFVRL